MKYPHSSGITSTVGSHLCVFDKVRAKNVSENNSASVVDKIQFKRELKIGFWVGQRETLPNSNQIDLQRK